MDSISAGLGGESIALAGSILRAVPCPALLVERGTGRILRANHLALSLFPSGDTVSNWKCGVVEETSGGEAAVVLIDGRGRQTTFPAHLVPHIQSGKDTALVFFDPVARMESDGESIQVRKILSSIPDLVILFDVHGVYRRVYTSREDVLARPSSEMIGRSVYEVLSRHAEYFRETFRAALETGLPQSMKYELDVPAGSRWFSARVARIDLMGEEQPLILCAVQDISESEQTREALTFRLEMENLVFSLASRFLALEAVDLTNSMRRGLEQLLSLSGADSIFLFIEEETPGRYMLFHQASQPGRALPFAGISWVDLSHSPSWQQPLRKGVLSLMSRDEMRQAGPGWEFLWHLPIESLVAAPIIRHGDMCGFLGFASEEKTHKWSSEFLSLAQLGGAVYSNAFTRLRTHMQIEQSKEELEESLRAIRRRDAILGAVNFAAENFMRDTDWRASLNQFLSKIAIVAQAEAVSLAEQDTDNPGRLHIHYYWPISSTPTFLSEEPIESFPWGEALMAGNLVWTEDCRAGITPAGALSLPEGPGLLIPVISSGKWRGFLALANCRAKRDWTGEELDALNTAARLIGAALQRERQSREILQHQEQIFKAEKIATIGRLTSGVAHDFNNLLTIVLGYADLMAQQADEAPPTWANFLREIQIAGAKAQKLTRELLAYGRNQGALPQRINFNKFIAERLETLKRVMRETVSVTLQESHDCPDVMADPGHMEQVLVNLLMNASDAIDGDGTVLITLEHRKLSRQQILKGGGSIGKGSYVVWTVKDNGSGMDDETLARAIEPFFSTKGTGKGSGMGLPMVLGLVEQHGGQVEIRSKPGSGTSVSVYLPSAGDSLPNVDGPAETVDLHKEKSKKETTKRSLRVLLAEDADMVRQFVHSCLKGAGYTVTEARDGEEAWKIFESSGPESFDLLLTDVVMPRLNGRELGKRVRAKEPAIPIIFMTGYSDDNVWSKEKDGGRIECLYKPFSTMQLIEAIDTLVDPSGGSR